MQIEATIRDHHLLIKLEKESLVRILSFGKCAMDECLKGILHHGRKIHWCKTLGNDMK